ncbi:UbiA family prenyltransferase [Candidatus Bathyarchaeota archaeon]|nr:UbiA family prenyltransferase [Candidatus Bathyarchaeota archaeon]
MLLRKSKDKNSTYRILDGRKEGAFNFFRKESLIHQALKYLTSSTLLLALNGSMVVIFGFFLYGIKIFPDLILASFLVTFGVYSLNKATDKVEDSINQPEIPSRTMVWYVVPSIMSMLIGLSIGLLEGLIAFIILAGPIAIGLVYSIKISKSIPRLKEIIGIKSFTVALSWGVTGCFLPAFMSNHEMIFLVFIYIFIRVLVGTILCDVLDEKGDSFSGITTIPIRLGRNRTKNLLILVNSFAVVWLVYSAIRGIFLLFMPALILGVVSGYFAIWWFFSGKCKRLTASLLLDSEWLPIIIAIILLKNFFN